MAEKSKKYDEILSATRQRAIQMLLLCEDAQTGKISGEEFEKRITKTQNSACAGNRIVVGGIAMCVVFAFFSLLSSRRDFKD